MIEGDIDRTIPETKGINLQFSQILDLIRVFALLLVILAHATEVYLKFKIIPPGKNLAGLVMMTTFARSAVPLFVVISGYLHLLPHKSDEPVETFLKKKLYRIKPAIFWIVIYWLWDNPDPLLLSELLKKFVSGEVYIHLWFVYLLIGLYVVTPILRIFTKNATNMLLQYFLVLWFFLSSVDYFSRISLFNFVVAGYISIGYIGYYVFGHWVYRFQKSFSGKDLSTKKSLLYWMVGLFFLSFTGLSVLTFNHIVETGSFSAIYLDSLNPLVITMGLSLTIIFILLEDLKRLSRFHSVRISRFVKSLGGLSFSVYLAHMIFLKTLASYAWFYQIPYVLGTLVLFIITVLITYLTIAIIHKIPIIRGWL